MSKATTFPLANNANYENLEVAASITDTATDVQKSTMAFEVVAPATLMAGYELEVNVDGKAMIVVIPPGGVQVGQTFRPDVIFPLTSTKNADGLHHIPVGHWRDGLCDCCNHGCCHPLCWLAYCCGPVALAQILYRMQLNWCGFPTDRQDAARSFRIVIGIYVFMIVAIVAVYAILYGIFFCAFRAVQDPDNNENVQSDFQQMIFLSNMLRLLALTFTIYIVIVMARARRFIRNKYAIPTECCDDCEDCCCSYWCTCCTITQMARHTADYNAHPAQCCTMTGLPSHLPEDDVRPETIV